MSEAKRVDAEIVTMEGRAADTAPDNILSVIERIASNPDIEVERMRTLLQMRADEEARIRQMEREDREEAARRAWMRDFSRVQAEIGPIVRTRKNTHTSSSYADLADIDRVVTPILTKHGFLTSSGSVPGAPDGFIRMRLIIGHSEGHERAYEDIFPLDGAGSQGRANKTGIQAKGSTDTYARRYLKAAALDLAFMDDTDGNSPRPSAPAGNITQAQFEELHQLIEDTQSDLAKFLKHFGIDGLDMLPAAKFASARQMLLQKKAGNS